MKTIFFLSGVMLAASGTKVWAADWVTEPWDANDRPYQAAQKSLESEVTGKSMAEKSAIYAKYRAQANSEPQSSLALFRMTYLSFLLSMQKVPDLQFDIPLKHQLDKTNGRSYWFARTHYLLERLGYNYAPEIRQVGRRLLARNPNDLNVLRSQPMALDPRIPAERKETFALIQHLIALRPKDYYPYYVMGRQYEGLWQTNNIKNRKWDGSKDEEDRLQAIAAFRKSQALLGPEDKKRFDALEKKISLLNQKRLPF